MSLAQKIGLGTVQWGMAYGIANRSGPPGWSEVQDILKLAASVEIDLLDTAYAYGDAEAVIGRTFSTAKPSRIVTKTMPITADKITDQDVAAVDEAFRQSLERLRRPRVAGLMVHHAQNLLAPGRERLWEWLEKVRAQGLAERIGVSLYDPQQYFQISALFKPTLVQIPMNIYDRRFSQSGALKAMKAAGVEVHTRSAFLQGLLLMKPEGLPPFFAPIREHHAKLHHWLGEHRMSPLMACLAHCLTNPDVDRVIVGCETADQFDGILKALSGLNPAMLVPDEFGLNDEAILNPSRWPPR